MTLREWLIAKQMELGDTDTEFAARLRLSTAGWSRLRNGQYAASLSVARHAVKALPRQRTEIVKLALTEPMDCAVGGV